MRRRVHGEGTLLAAIFAVSVVARIYAAGQRVTPLYYPDEYIYASISRSISSTGVPRFRGEFLHFSSLLAPYLMAPAWWIGNVGTAYHVVLDLGAIWFSLAVFPAYALARRLGISPRGSVGVALLAVLVPDAAFATAAMTEPYAYPLFITTLLVALNALVSPSRMRQLGVVALLVVLCLARVQFAFVVVLYVVAALTQAGGSWRKALRSQPIVAAALGLGLVVVASLGPSSFVGFYSFPADPSTLFSMWRWSGLNVFVVSVAAGWVVVPGAIVGLASFVRSADPSRQVVCRTCPRVTWLRLSWRLPTSTPTNTVCMSATPSTWCPCSLLPAYGLWSRSVGDERAG